MDTVKLIHITPDAEKLIAYCARVSSPHQESEEIDRLLAYCAKHGHWSVFEMAGMCLEINTSRGISPQILRHRSFSFQEFSQRYASPDDFIRYEARRQDVKNRQNSIEGMPEETIQLFNSYQGVVWDIAKKAYDNLIELGVAKECARFLLPLNVKTRLYMHGTVRSWIHYINLRTTPSTQKEHREIAMECRNIFVEQMPSIAKALGWEGEPK